MRFPRKGDEMPIYLDLADFGTVSDETSAAFKEKLSPGIKAPHSGIYKCDSCGFEAVSTEGNSLPPAKTCEEHDKARWKCAKGEIKWRLVAYAIHLKDK
jgi:hypothetical protein